MVIIECKNEDKMSEFDQEIDGAIARAQQAFGDISNLGPELYAERLGALPNSNLATDIFDNYKKDFNGDLETHLLAAGVKESDSALLKIFKLHEFEKSHTKKSNEKSSGE